MRAKLMKNIEFDKRKVWVSILFGLFCFFISNEPHIIDSAYDVYIIWGIALPVIISLAWGIQYSLISLIGGLAVFSPFAAMTRNGYANLATCFFVLLLCTVHAHVQQIYEKNKSLFYMNHIVHLLLIFIITQLNEPLITYLVKGNIKYWHLSYAYTFIPSNIISNNLFILLEVMTILIFSVRSLLTLDTVKLIFGKEIDLDMKENSFIILGMIAIAAILIGIDFEGIGRTSIGMANNNYTLELGKWKVALLKIALVAYIGDLLLHFIGYKGWIQQVEKNSREKYVHIFENILDIYIEFDSSGKVLEISPSACKVLGIPIDNKEINLFRFFAYEYHRGIFIEKLVNGKPMKNDELVMRKDDRSLVWLLISSVTKVKENHYVIVARDITEVNKFIDERNELFETQQAVFEACNDLIFTLNGSTGKFVNYNKSCKEYFEERYRIEINEETNFWKLFETKEEENKWYTYMLKAKEEGKYTTELVDEKNEKIFELRLFLIRINENKFDISVFAKDVTEQRKFAKRIQRINEELEQRVKERTADMQKAYDELESFSYVVSHEIKTPVRVIEAYNDILYEDDMDKLSEDGKEAVIGIKDYCHRALEMIEGILKYARANVKEINLEPVDMQKLVLEICSEFSMTNKERKFCYEVSNLPVVQADSSLLRQVIYNIVSNAIKFSAKEEETRLYINYMEDEKEYTFYFKDNGVGFDEKYANKMFQMFQRMHSQEEFEGTGIGLAMIKKIIEKHGGRTFILSKTNKGCIIGFTLLK